MIDLENMKNKLKIFSPLTWGEFLADFGQDVGFVVAAMAALFQILGRAAAAKTAVAAAAALNEVEEAMKIVGLPLWWRGSFFDAVAPWDGWETTWPDRGRTRFDVPTYRWVAELPTFDGPPEDVTPEDLSEAEVLVPRKVEEELEFVLERVRYWKARPEFFAGQPDEVLRELVKGTGVRGAWHRIGFPEERVLSDGAYETFRDEISLIARAEQIRRNNKEK